MTRFAPRLLAVCLLLLTACAASGWADTIHWGGFPHPIGPVAESITNLYNVIFVIVAVIFMIVLVPIMYALWRFRRSRVSQPATFSHNNFFELAWTLIPALICFFIAWESYHVMVSTRTMPANAMNVEVVGFQFGWDFFYPDVSRNGVHVSVAEASKPDPFLSSTGQDRLVKELVVPTGKPIVLHVTGADVIHAFYVPAFGIKIDAIPGRINYAWFEATTPGLYLGQCAELCGAGHSEMFFRVKAVSPAEFATYIAEREKAAGLDPNAVAVSGTLVSGTTVPVSGTAVSENPVMVSGTTAPAPTGAAVAVSPAMAPAQAGTTPVSSSTK